MSDIEFSGSLGPPTVTNWQEYVTAVEEDNDALRARLAALTDLANEMVKTFVVKGSIGGIDSHLRSDWLRRDTVARWRSVLDSVPEGE